MTTPAPFGRLHIVPIIALPRGMASEHVTFSMHAGPSSQALVLRDPVVRAFGETDVIVVAGTPKRPNGWVARLPYGLAASEANVVFEWQCGDAVVMHIIHFDLTDLGRADDPFWTMDSSYWSLAGYAETRNMLSRDRRRIMAVTAFSEADFPETNERAFTTRREAGTFIIEERLTLHAIEYETAVRAALKWGRSKEHLESEAPCGAL